jgi:hypothetical protein
MNKQNRITEKYFQGNTFATRIPAVLDEISKKIDFHVLEELFRGRIYTSDRTGSVVLRKECGKKSPQFSRFKV